MAVLRVIAVCLAAAMLCSALRPLRPEMAMAVSLAAGAAAIAMLVWQYRAELAGLSNLWQSAMGETTSRDVLLRAAGIAILSELGAQLCADAGERALGGRIVLAGRVAILCLCVPLITEIGQQLQGLC